MAHETSGKLKAAAERLTGTVRILEKIKAATSEGDGWPTGKHADEFSKLLAATRRSRNCANRLLDSIEAHAKAPAE